MERMTNSIFVETGKKLYQDFINDRLLSTPTVSVWEPLEKLKLKTFFNLGDKLLVQTGDKMVCKRCQHSHDRSVLLMDCSISLQ